MRSIASALVVLALLVPTIATAGVVEPTLANALTALGDKLDDSPRDAALLTDRANLLVRAGRIEEALADYRTALEIEPLSPITLYNLGLLELELGNKRTAGQLLRRSLAIDPDFARGHYALGMVLAQRGHNVQAVRRYATAFNLDADLQNADRNPELLFNELATWASMASYLTNSVERGTRLYNNPQPIVGLLIEGLSAPAEPPAEPPAVGAPAAKPTAEPEN
jgi:Flp pilus assembly protein TadD